MRKSWRAEIDLSLGQATRLVNEQCPDLAPAHLEFLGAGWDNKAYRVNRRWVFRFPRRLLAVDLLKAETRVLPEIAQGLPLAIPQPCYLGQPGVTYPWPFTGYLELPGRTACRARLDDVSRIKNAKPLALFLAALHGIGHQRAQKIGAPPDQLRRLDMPYRIRLVEERLAHAQSLALVKDSAPYRAVIEAAPIRWQPTPKTLVHGDLYARHLLLTDDDHLSGVIDWGDLHFGDPAIDLSIAYAFLPPMGRSIFFQCYGSVDADRRRVARLRALLSALTLLIYGQDIGDRHLLWEGSRALSLIAQDSE